MLAGEHYDLLAHWTRRRHGAPRIGSGVAVSAGDSLIRAPAPHSKRPQFVRRYDYPLVVRNAYVPLEQKPSAR